MPLKRLEIINSILGKTSNKQPDYMSFENSTINDQREIAESFNKYFSNIANNLARNTEQPHISYTLFLPETLPSFFLRHTFLEMK